VYGFKSKQRFETQYNYSSAKRGKTLQHDSKKNKNDQVKNAWLTKWKVPDPEGKRAEKNLQTNCGYKTVRANKYT